MYIYIYIFHPIRTKQYCQQIESIYIYIKNNNILYLVFSTGDITPKGFEKKKSKLLAPYVQRGQ